MAVRVAVLGWRHQLWGLGRGWHMVWRYKGGNFNNPWKVSTQENPP